jgi:hypothetical protein
MRSWSAAVVLAVLALAGCGGDDPEQQVTALMTELREAQESGDAERACEQVYVIRERDKGAEREEEEGGEAEGGEEGCREAFEQAVERRRAELKDLKTRLVRVDVEGDEATAVLHTTAVRRDGSQLERDVPYDVVRTSEGWRVRIAGEG